jgi:hypothetical protein
MERRDFIKSGTLITATFFAKGLLANSLLIAQSGSNDDDVRSRRPNPDQYNQPILKAIAYGMSAPNPHNTQAWKFKVLDDNSMLFFVDEKRMVPFTDPPARQIHIGTGCFLAYLQIAMQKEGYATAIDYLPEGEYPLEEIGKKPVAKVTLSKTAQFEDKLFSQLYIRQTNRVAYKGNMITAQEHQQMVADSGKLFYETKLITEEPLFAKLTELLYKAWEVEATTYDTYHESLVWWRVKDDITKKRDGLNFRASGKKGLELQIVENLFKDYSPESWHSENSVNKFLRDFYSDLKTSKGYLLWITPNNKLIDWVKSGEDYARTQLAASLQGIYFHPLNQVIQEYPSMKVLYDDFNKTMGINDPEKVQMVCRIGRSKPLFYSYRRNLNDCIIK